jgi:hypothetical protein
MNKFFFLFLFSAFLFSQCSNDFDLVEEWKDIPVVYGLLSLSDTAQYIRVEKAFIDPEVAGTTIAMIPDSLYYEQATVSLDNLTSGDSWVLDKVDGNAEGYVRDEGAFATAPNYLYKVLTDKIIIRPGDEFLLKINRGEDKALVTAETTVMDTFLITQPGNNINFGYLAQTKVQWVPIGNKNLPALYDVHLLIHYRELDLNDPDLEWIPKTLDWTFDRNVEQTSTSQVGKSFYLFMASALGETPANIKREIANIDVVVIAGSSEIKEYITLGSANLGITASGEVPKYTNLSEGYGIFGSRYIKIKDGIPLRQESIDSLRYGSFTKQLNFL